MRRAAGTHGGLRSGDAHVSNNDLGEICYDYYFSFTITIGSSCYAAKTLLSTVPAIELKFARGRCSCRCAGDSHWRESSRSSHPTRSGTSWSRSAREREKERVRGRKEGFFRFWVPAICIETRHYDWVWSKKDCCCCIIHRRPNYRLARFLSGSCSTSSSLTSA